MLLDANVLLYATDPTSASGPRAQQVLVDALNGDERVGLPWQSIGAFMRIATNPRAAAHPMTGEEAWEWVEQWLALDITWIPPATDVTARCYGELASKINITSNLVPDAMLAALAIEHGQVLWSADTDFARFPGLQWLNPMTDR
jgi:uncharacterized protein